MYTIEASGRLSAAAVPPPRLSLGKPLVVAPAEKRRNRFPAADLAHELGGPDDEVAERMAGARPVRNPVVADLIPRRTEMATRTRGETA